MVNTMRDAFDLAGHSEAAALRTQMVQRHLLGRGIRDERVLDAMLEVPREAFVPEDVSHLAYVDGPLPIGFGQTISQPFTVAFMCEAARLTRPDHVLEIGTGSGYGAAVLSRLCRIVDTVERFPQLADEALLHLQQLGYENVTVHTADGVLGWPKAAPYDAIIVTAAAAALPQAYLDQLVPGGRIVMPLEGMRFRQALYRFTKRRDGVQVENLGGFTFVPLVSDTDWEPADLLDDDD
jgi:protein-L-isoaspartate(D-aspartate) O-methyltransferase